MDIPDYGKEGKNENIWTQQDWLCLGNSKKFPLVKEEGREDEGEM